MQSLSTKELSVKIEDFGKTAGGNSVKSYTLSNQNGIEVTVLDFGGVITSIKTPDKEGNLGDIVLGFNNIETYEGDSPYMGALVGRYANRIANGKFSIDGKEYTLAQNNGANCLHGGVVGFDKKIWAVEILQGDNDVALSMTYESEHMEEGFPGNLSVKVIYRLTNEDNLEIEYFATTDQKTVINLTQHTYFNLSADPSTSVLDHELTVWANKFLPINKDLIPTGERRGVDGTPFDFTSGKKIGKDISAAYEQLELAKGYDHSWIFENNDKELVKAAFLKHMPSGRILEVFTTEPAMQVYTSNFLDASLTGKEGVSYDERSAVCLETQHYPDSPNQSDFPTTLLNPGEKFHSKTIFGFKTEQA